MITGGVLDKHPRLKMVSVENDIGWMPNYLKRLEWYSYRFGPRFPKLKGKTPPTSGGGRCTPPSRTTSRASAVAT